jgi:UDP-glucose 4-epimerase
MKVAVIGGCGFIGSHVCDQLLKRGFEIRIIGRCKHDNNDNIKHIFSDEAVEFTQADVRIFESIEKATKNCDAIMHYAALINVDESIQNPRPFYDVNVFGTFNVLEIARKEKIPLVYKSTCEVFGHIRIQIRPMKTII